MIVHDESATLDWRRIAACLASRTISADACVIHDDAPSIAYTPHGGAPNPRWRLRAAVSLVVRGMTVPAWERRR